MLRKWLMARMVLLPARGWVDKPSTATRGVSTVGRWWHGSLAEPWVGCGAPAWIADSPSACPSAQYPRPRRGTCVAEWNVTISEEADRLVRVRLAGPGLKAGDLSAFVERAVRRELLREVGALRAAGPDLSRLDGELLARDLLAIELGLEDARAGRGRPMKQAIHDLAGELGLELSP